MAGKLIKNKDEAAIGATSKRLDERCGADVRTQRKLMGLASNRGMPRGLLLMNDRGDPWPMHGGSVFRLSCCCGIGVIVAVILVIVDVVVENVLMVWVREVLMFTRIFGHWNGEVRLRCDLVTLEDWRGSSPDRKVS